ncbi:hypothetical protein HPB49_004644 [Dermacentor silvarum]|uniref:Uncharacterized protein n=1 Tax=Dermacentor silvarum TaxID=543639 RepID=A0ACB8DAX5_DERSI|nr:hypothetical protein HPB49_004644 [Dermacentor silvarum]
MARPTARWRSAVIACLFCGIAKLPMGISHEEQTIDILGALRAARRQQTCVVSAPPIFGCGRSPNQANQAKLALSDPEHRAEQLDTKFFQVGPFYPNLRPFFDRRRRRLRYRRPAGWSRPSEGKMAASALQLRAYDPEAMAWTTVPTTGQGQYDGVQRHPGRRLIGRKHERSRDARHGTQGQGVIKPAPDDYVIVIKPTERVSLHEAFTETGYGTAISAYLKSERARATSVLPSRDQNIIVHTSDIEAADRLIGDIAVNAEKGSVPLHGYLRQDGGNTCHGVIVVRNTDTTETLQHRVCWRASTIVEIRKFGTSNKARITFAGKEKPYVHYDNMVVSVQNYYKTIPACGQCGAVGHRADACPNLQPNTCGLCGLHAPLVEGVWALHNCVPRCSEQPPA